ncbi:Bug family tripartite tricarboxylate transporter substrate binding protein [Plastoroseomonas hellenica]|uniref:Bug family tripartite tricarboxylate transporter substrate binding protein n=1 Tax=Plastoroseomonas hellenica TaxID=2687306 RepID=UPI001BAB81A2|nr:tripartite tricarboxylate transporter substrate binding protein [Plastoroseomonas hellenica]MBR0641925.1 tripartite tricarboxylate transporter substrate binding protein [Plastoroseomonas hellenica]
MTLSRRGLGAAALSGLAAPAFAQAPWPNAQPIRLVVPFAPGGTTDIIARILSAELSRRIGQTVLVENRPGAGGTLGTGQVARAAPDGYTLVLSLISAMVVGKVLYGDRAAWSPDRDFAQVAMVMSTPYLILVRPDLPIRSLAELVAEARRRPDGLSYGTSGTGGMPHLVMVRFLQAAGIQMTHVPYRGAAPVVTDIAAGVLPMMVDSLTAASANIRSGALRALAHTWPERVPAFPDIPTFREEGFADLVVDGWSGIAAPAGTPRPILERLAQAVRETLATPEVQRRYAETATAPGRLFLDDAQRFVREEIATWTPIIRASGATVD